MKNKELTKAFLLTLPFILFVFKSWGFKKKKNNSVWQSLGWHYRWEIKKFPETSWSACYCSCFQSPGLLPCIPTKTNECIKGEENKQQNEKMFFSISSPDSSGTFTTGEQSHGPCLSALPRSANLQQLWGLLRLAALFGWRLAAILRKAFILQKWPWLAKPDPHCVEVRMERYKGKK